MTLRKTILLLTTPLLLPIAASRGADILYDTTSETVHTNGNFSDTTWLGLSFRTSDAGYVLDTVSIPISNPNLLTTGTITFRLVDTTGPNGLPGNLVGGMLGSRSIQGISANSYDSVTFSGLNRTLAKNTNYWIVVGSSGLTFPYYIGATTSTGGITPGSLGFTVSNSNGTSWNAASTSSYAIARIVAVPEPSAWVLGAIAALTLGIAIRRMRQPETARRPG